MALRILTKKCTFLPHMETSGASLNFSPKTLRKNWCHIVSHSADGKGSLQHATIWKRQKEVFPFYCRGANKAVCIYNAFECCHSALFSKSMPIIGLQFSCFKNCEIASSRTLNVFFLLKINLQACFCLGQLN